MASELHQNGPPACGIPIHAQTCQCTFPSRHFSRATIAASIRRQSATAIAAVAPLSILSVRFLCLGWNRSHYVWEQR